ncbi:MAG: hypothetical protein ACK41D_05450 [Rubricoccaceae bacterium]
MRLSLPPMRLSLPPVRLSLLALLFLAAPGAASQSRLSLDATSLHAGGTRYALSGTPLAAERFEGMRLRIPGQGDFLVLDRPFPGARQAGAFEAGGLFFVAEGVSVRLATAAPILPDTPARLAYVRPAGPPPPERSLLARVALTPIQTSELPARADGSSLAHAMPTSPQGLLDEARIAALTQERDRLLARLAEVQDELLVLLNAAPGPQASTWKHAAPGAPSFDVPDAQRLRNADAAQQALHRLNRAAGVPAPYTADVLLVADASGRVETAVVAQRQDARVDALIEDFARGLRLEPPLVHGLPAIVRTQVRVRLVPQL